MSFADQMLNLRRQIDEMHATRMSMLLRLRQFRTELTKNMAHRMGEMRKSFSEQCMTARSARQAFKSHNRARVGEMLHAFGSDRLAGRRHFMSRHA